MNKKIRLILCIVAAFTISLTLNHYSKNKFNNIEIKRYVTSKSCSSCYQINKKIFEAHKDINVFYVDKSKEATIKEFGTTLVKVPILELATGEVLQGKEEINNYIEGNSNKKTNIDTTMLGVVTAAFIDSINICAISCILFLISFLKGRGSKIISTLILFIGTIYITYTGVGIVLMTATNVLFKIPALYKVIGIAMSLFLIYALNKALGKLDKEPEFRCEGGVCKIDWEDDEKSKIDKFIEKAFLKNESIILFAVFIAISEFACSGMVYIPTLMLISDASKRILYLLVYNAIFVLPLVTVGIFYKRIQVVIEEFSKKTNSVYLTVFILVGLLGLTFNYYF